MKSLLSILKKQDSKLSGKIESEWNKFNDKSDRWHESEAADMKQTKIEDMETIHSSLLTFIEEVEQHISEN